MTKPTEMTTLRLMTEYHELKYKERPTEDDQKRQKEIWSELRERVQKQ